jgi:hypothetical protein
MHPRRVKLSVISYIIHVHVNLGTIMYLALRTFTNTVRLVFSVSIG